MNRMWLAAAAALVCADGAFAVEASPQELERNCHNYALAADVQIAACTSLIPLYGDKIETIGIKALAHLARATAYGKSGDAARAGADYREAIRLDTVPLEAGSMEALLYNDRCWVRAIAMIELDKALADCNEALRLRPGFVAALDSRAFLQLKQGNAKEALADYEAVLKDSPTDSYSIFGRGVAKLRLGDTAGGNADIAAAVAMEKNLREEFAAYGLTP
jgi:tetratricopeptide (TPR) repeat protein